MSKSITYKNLFDGGKSTYHPDGTKTITYKNLVDGGYTSYHADGSRSITYKNLFDGGYTTYHPDGSRSITYKNLIDEGYTTYHPDGTRSITYKNLMDGGYTTYSIDGDGSEDSFQHEKYRSNPGGIGNSIENLSRELLSIDADLFEQLKVIDNECSKMTIAINEIQAVFGDQENGRLLISRLYQTIKDLVEIKGMLCLARITAKEYIDKIRE